MVDSNIDFYNVAILLSFLFGMNVIVRNCIKKKYSNDEIIILVVYMLIGFIIGGKYYTYISHDYETFNFFNLGLSSLGSLIGGLIMIIIYKFDDMLYILIPAVLLLYGIGKIGCFLTGCCLGLKYNGLFKITYNYSSVVSNEYSYFPVQIIESIVFLILFVYIYIVKKNKKYDVYKLIIISFVIKFLLDFLRLNHEYEIISFNQIICILCVIIVSLYLFIRKKTHH